MISFLALLFFALPKDWSPEAIHVTKGDPILPLDITDISGNRMRLEDVVENSMVFIFSTKCNRCKEAIQNIPTRFQTSEIVLLFPETSAAVKQFLADNKSQDFEGASFLVKPSDLESYNIKTLSAALGYRDSRLKLAFHGPVNDQGLSILHKYFHR